MRIPRRSLFSRATLLRWAAAWAAGAFACVFFPATLVCAQDPAIEGQPVKEVRVIDESGAPVAEKIPPLPLQEGKPFDFAAERESLRDLYRLGDYSDIHVTASSAADGLLVDFVVRRNFFNNVIRIEGLKEPPSEPAALASLRLGLGEPFRESSLREAADRLQQTLRDEGLYESKVTWDLTPHEDTRQM